MQRHTSFYSQGIAAMCCLPSNSSSLILLAYCSVWTTVCEFWGTCQLYIVLVDLWNLNDTLSCILMQQALKKIHCCLQNLNKFQKQCTRKSIYKSRQEEMPFHTTTMQQIQFFARKMIQGKAIWGHDTIIILIFYMWPDHARKIPD